MAGDPRVSIILATYNECEIIQDTVRAILQSVKDPVEVIVVDDDSPDRTWEVVEKMGDPRVKVIRRVGTRGLASALHRGILESRGEVIGWMDSDLGMPAARLPEMIERLSEFDVVVGSRYMPGGADIRAPLRVLSSRMINGLARLVLGRAIRDYDSGFIVLRRSVFNSVTMIARGYGEYFIELLYHCRRKKLKILEVPYQFHEREKGVSKSAPNLWRFFRTGMQYVVRIFAARFRKID